MTEDATTRQLCCAPAPNDRYGRRCEKPLGHDGTHWTCVGEDETLTWQAEDATTPPTPRTVSELLAQTTGPAPSGLPGVLQARDATTPPTTYKVIKWCDENGEGVMVSPNPAAGTILIDKADYDTLAAERDQLQTMYDQQVIAVHDYRTEIRRLMTERDQLQAEKQNLYTLAQKLQQQILRLTETATRARERERTHGD